MLRKMHICTQIMHQIQSMHQSLCPGRPLVPFSSCVSTRDSKFIFKKGNLLLMVTSGTQSTSKSTTPTVLIRCRFNSERDCRARDTSSDSAVPFTVRGRADRVRVSSGRANITAGPKDNVARHGASGFVSGYRNDAHTDSADPARSSPTD